ncbi:transcriptional regulator Kaiso-like isoform X2 [Ambystoma mexicanum]
MESRNLITATDTQYSGRLLASLNEQRTNGIFCDVTVIVEDKKFKAHKNILSASSTYFHQLFSVAGQVVELSFVRAEIFAEILNYIYSSKIVGVRTDLLEELIRSGQSLGVRFIADLGVPLSQMKSMANVVKDNHIKALPADFDKKTVNLEKSPMEKPTKDVLAKDGDMRSVPIQAQRCITPGEEIKELKRKLSSRKRKGEDSEDDDVVFCSETLLSKPHVSKHIEATRQTSPQEKIPLSDQQMSVNNSISEQDPIIPKAKSPAPSNLPSKEVPLFQANSLSASEHIPCKMEAAAGNDHDLSSETMLPKSPVSNNPEIAQQRTKADIGKLSNQQVHVSSSPSAETLLVPKATSPNNLSLNVVVPCPTEPTPVKTSNQTDDDTGRLSPRNVPPKLSLSNNTEMIQEGTNPDKSSSQQISSENCIPAQTPSAIPPQKTGPDMLSLTGEQTSSNTSTSLQTPSILQKITNEDMVKVPSEQTNSNSNISAQTPSAPQQKTNPDMVKVQSEDTSSNISAQPPSIPQANTNPDIVKLSGDQTNSTNTISAQTASIPQQKTKPDMVTLSNEQISTNNSISDQSPSVPRQTTNLDMVKLSSEHTSSKNSISAQTPCVPRQTTNLDMVKLSSEQTSSKNSISAQTPCVPRQTTNLDMVKLSSEQTSSKNSISAQTPCVPKQTTNLDMVKLSSEQTSSKNSISAQTPSIPQQKTNPDVVKLSSQPISSSNSISTQMPSLPKAKPPNNLPLKAVKSPQVSSSVNKPGPNQTQASSTYFGPTQNHLPDDTTLINPPSSISTFAQNHLSQTINFLVQQLPSINTFVNKPVIINSSSWGTGPNVLSSPVNLQSKAEKAATAAAFDGPKLQNPQMPIFHKETTSKPEELTIRIAGVNSANNKDGSVGKEIGSQHIMDGKKIITLDTPSEIGGLSTGCKVYANIGEDTYDIVIPIKGDPDEDGEVELPRSVDGSPDSKRVKVKHEDHYELNVDGKVYYICLVCKRSYVSRTSLRRHYNVHSWEKKYPCHFCEKVFALAEYRTKHEVMHTGEKRYQCLTCGESFINHRVMSSHMKSAHNQDPSGDPKLYRLHPFKSLHTKQSSDISNAQPSSSAPVPNDGIGFKKEETPSEVPETVSPSKPMNWEDVFGQPGEQAIFKECTTHNSTEFEFVIPESY